MSRHSPPSRPTQIQTRNARVGSPLSRNLFVPKNTRRENDARRSKWHWLCTPTFSCPDSSPGGVHELSEPRRKPALKRGARMQAGNPRAALSLHELQSVAHFNFGVAAAFITYVQEFRTCDQRASKAAKNHISEERCALELKQSTTHARTAPCTHRHVRAAVPPHCTRTRGARAQSERRACVVEIGSFGHVLCRSFSTKTSEDALDPPRVAKVDDDRCEVVIAARIHRCPDNPLRPEVRVLHRVPHLRPPACALRLHA